MSLPKESPQASIVPPGAAPSKVEPDRRKKLQEMMQLEMQLLQKLEQKQKAIQKQVVLSGSSILQ